MHRQTRSFNTNTSKGKQTLNTLEPLFYISTQIDVEVNLEHADYIYIGPYGHMAIYCRTDTFISQKNSTESFLYNIGK